jgi:hypothetical protein
MKLNAFVLPAVVGLLVALTVPLSAQPINLKADIPFEFQVRGQLMPAGTYNIEQLSSVSSQPEVMTVVDQAFTHKIVFLVQPVTGNRVPEQAKLVFTRFQDRYFLSQIWTTDTAQGLQLRKSRTELELISKALATPQQDVVILAKR